MEVPQPKTKFASGTSNSGRRLIETGNSVKNLGVKVSLQVSGVKLDFLPPVALYFTREIGI
jgi:hypothetical protein